MSTSLPQQTVPLMRCAADATDFAPRPRRLGAAFLLAGNAAEKIRHHSKANPKIGRPAFLAVADDVQRRKKPKKESFFDFGKIVMHLKTQEITPGA